MVTKLEVLLGGASIPFYRLTVEKQEKRAADRCVFEARRTQSVAVGNDVKVRTVEATPKYLFSGRVYEIDEEYDMKKVTAFSYGARIDEVRVFPSRYYSNRSPEYIAQDLIVSVVGLTWGSSWNSGVTLTSYEAMGTVGENIRRLARIAGADFWTATDSTGAIKFYFQPASLTNLGVTLNLSGSGANAKRLDHNPSATEIVNAAEVWGRTKQSIERYVYNLTSSIFPNDYISLARPLSSLRVLVKGVQLSEGIGNDYVYNYMHDLVRQPAVVFNTTLGTSLELIIEGTMDASSLAYAENSGSVATYGKKMKTYIFENIERESDLQALAQKIVSIYGSPRRTLVVQVPGIRADISDGGLLTVNDPLIGISNTSFIVRKVTWKYPEGVTELELGQFLPEIYEFEREYPSLAESASRSSWMSSYRYDARRLYLSGNGITYPYSLKFGLKDSVDSSSTYTFTSSFSSVDVGLGLQIIGQYTRTYFIQWLATIYPSSAIQTIYLSRYQWLVADYLSNNNYLNADASGNLTIKIQFHTRRTGTFPWNLWAPDPSDSTAYFTTTVTGVKRILPTMWGGMLTARVDSSTLQATLYWGQSSDFVTVNGSHLFNVGFELL